ncbi:uncharacterized protein METZ01_LOCUS333909, partial [marine metagenome]
MIYFHLSKSNFLPTGLSEEGDDVRCSQGRSVVVSVIIARRG